MDSRYTYEARLGSLLRFRYSARFARSSGLLRALAGNGTAFSYFFCWLPDVSWADLRSSSTPEQPVRAMRATSATAAVRVLFTRFDLRGLVAGGSGLVQPGGQ